MQFASRCLELLPEGAVPSEGLFTVLWIAASGLHFGIFESWLWSERINAEQGQGDGQNAAHTQAPPSHEVPEGALGVVLSCPQTMQYMFAAMLVQMYPVLLHQEPSTDAAAAAVPVLSSVASQHSTQATSNTSSSSSASGALDPAATAAASASILVDSKGTESSSSSSSSSHSSMADGRVQIHNVFANARDSAATGWQKACSTSASVPACFSRLSRALGLTDRAVLLAVAKSSLEPDELWIAPELYARILCVVSQNMQATQFGPCELHLQLLAAWVGWLGELQRVAPGRFAEDAGASNLTTSLDCVLSMHSFNITLARDQGVMGEVKACRNVPITLQCAQQTLAYHQQQQGLSAEQEQARQMTLQEQQQQMVFWINPDAAAAVPRYHLPDLLQLLGEDHMQQMLRQPQLQQASGSSTGAVSISCGSVEAFVGMLLWQTTRCFLASLPWQFVQRSSSSCTDASSSQHSNHSSQLQSTALQQAQQLLAAWEAHIRCVAAATSAAAAAGMLNSTEQCSCHHVGLCIKPIEGISEKSMAIDLLQATAPGSPCQLQVVHLLCSVMKLNRVGKRFEAHLGAAVYTARTALVQLMNAALLQHKQQLAAGLVGCAAGQCTEGTWPAAPPLAAAATPVVDDTAAAADQTAAAGATGVSTPPVVLPTQLCSCWYEGSTAAAVLWLHVIGLCCVELAAQLRELLATVTHNSTAAKQYESGAAVSAAGAAAASTKYFTPCLGECEAALDVLWNLLLGCPLTADLQVSQGLSEVLPLPIVQAVQLAYLSLQNSLRGANVNELVATCSNVPGALENAGLSLSSLATRHACNNPNCSNTEGPSELLLMRGRSCVCGSCRTAHYCSRACQMQHRKQHKPVCQALGAARAAAA